MKKAIIRSGLRSQEAKSQLQVLLMDMGAEYTMPLKQLIESRSGIDVRFASSPEEAYYLMNADPERMYIGIADVAELNSVAIDKIELFRALGVPLIAIIDQYDEVLSDQLLKNQVIDYVVRSSRLDMQYISDLVARIQKNIHVKVMVVDDSRVSRFVLQRELKLQKFEVVEAVNAQEALQLLETQQDIRLALVDYQLPDTDGCALVAQMREKFAKDELLIIGLSSSSDSRLAVKFLKVGANDFISKPFNYEILLCRINQNLDMLDAVMLARDLSNTDYLSGLRNRRFFYQQGTLWLGTNSKMQPYTVVLMDIDNFKQVNDIYGHDVGDCVIQHFSRQIKEFFGEDLAARIGGEEFAVLTLESDGDTLRQRVEAFRLGVSQQYVEINGVQLRYTCSIGVCTRVAHSIDAMMKIADEQLYFSKKNGKNQAAYSQ